jgi:hypothetical protein
MELEAAALPAAPQTDDEAHLPRSTSSDAPMNLLLRFETSSGPRTVIACSVPRQVAREIADVMTKCGQHADFIDRCAPLSISDRVMIKNLH